MSSALFAGFTSRALVLLLLAAGSLPRVGAQTVTFEFAAPVDLGSNLARIGDLQWSHVLGTEWDENFSLGAIIGHQNATVIPEIREPLFNNVIIPQVTADTRTGARISGQVAGNTGLEFYADFAASGLASGASFHFQPEIVDLPSAVSVGELFKLNTSPGVVSNAAFTESLVDLPSFEAGMNFFFNLELDSKIEYGLFPFVPYGSVPINPDPVNVDQSLLKFGFDLDPDSNGGVGTPPNLVILENTPFEEQLGLLGDGESIYEKQISVEMSAEDDPVKRRLDIGSVQLVNPFGTGDSILGPNERNLTVSTTTDESSIQYSYETDLLRLGLDLDGIAAYLGTSALTGAGHSFTRIEEQFLDDSISLTADLLDVKYGPEVGFRETVDVKPDFEVTLSFDQEVAIDVDGQITLTDAYTGRWSDLPEIALLDDESVEVSVSFDQLTGEQTKRSVFYLTDYLELTLFELEELALEGVVSVSLPPLYRARTSLLGSLLGEVELQITEQTQSIAPFAFNSGLSGASTFTLTPAPSSIVYMASSAATLSTDPSDWRSLSDHTAPASLADAVLVLATGDSSDQLVTDLTPLPNPIMDRSGGVANIRGLVIPEGTLLRQGAVHDPDGRTWQLSSIVNDGTYSVSSSPLTINGLILTIEGEGEMRLSGPLDLDAAVFVHGQDHSMQLLPSSEVTTLHRLAVQQFDNAGSISVSELASARLTASQRFDNSGDISVSSSGQADLITPVLANEGLIEVVDPSSTFRISHADQFGQINLQSTTGAGRFVAALGGTLQFTDTVLLDTPGGNPQPISFHANTGGTIRFDHAIRAFDAGVAELHVDESSTMILHGVDVKREDGNVSLVNHGLVEVMFGSNRFYYNPNVPFEPGEEPRIVGINVDNQGTVRIHPGATLGFKAEIVNYVPGGATLGPATWELIGDVPAEPFVNSGEHVSTLGVRQAHLEIDVAYVVNEDTYLGRIDFGDTNGDGIDDGYSAEDYDTHLAISEASVLLSGAARFDYFNTIRENRGAFTLRNNNHFTTAGELLNSGEIRVESNARLNVSGDLVVDEGAVFVDSTSILDVGNNTVEVIGGNVTVERGPGTLFVNTPWTVREKWIGVDAAGNDVVREARVSYGDAMIRTIGPNADVLLDGKRAVFEPLSGLRLNQGNLTLTGGNELRLFERALSNDGTLTLSNAGKLYVLGIMLSSGHLEVGAESYLDVGETIFATGGTIQLDGVVQTRRLTVRDGALLSGAGRIVGELQNDGAVGPGSSPGSLQVLGDYTQSAEATLAIEIAGSGGGVAYDQLLVDDAANVSGVLDVSLSGGFALLAGQEFPVLTAGDLIDDGLTLTGDAASFFEMIVNEGTGGSVVLKFLGGDFPLPGDFDGNGVVDGSDFLAWQRGESPDPLSSADLADWQSNYGVDLARLPSATNAVPEPATGALVLLAAAGVCLRRRGCITQ